MTLGPLPDPLSSHHKATLLVIYYAAQYQPKKKPPRASDIGRTLRATGVEIEQRTLSIILCGLREMHLIERDPSLIYTNRYRPTPKGSNYAKQLG